MAIDIFVGSWRMCWVRESPFLPVYDLPLLGEQWPLAACAGQLRADGASDLAQPLWSLFSSAVAVGMACLGCFSNMAEPRQRGNRREAVYCSEGPPSCAMGVQVPRVPWGFAAAGLSVPGRFCPAVESLSL